MSADFIQQMSILDLLCEEEKEVRRIRYSDAVPFIMQIHYARRIPTIQYAFGLFISGILVGVCTFGQPASPSLCKGIAGEQNRNNVLELNRLVFLPQYNGNNNASYLVSHSLKQLPQNTFVVSYADWGGWNHVGYVYQATNFLYTGMTKERTDIMSESGHARHYNKGETKRQLRTAKHRYVYLVGNRKQRKKMLQELNYPIISDYPKGTSRHYDIDDPQDVITKRSIYDEHMDSLQ